MLTKELSKASQSTYKVGFLECKSLVKQSLHSIKADLLGPSSSNVQGSCNLSCPPSSTDRRWLFFFSWEWCGLANIDNFLVCWLSRFLSKPSCVMGLFINKTILSSYLNFSSVLLNLNFLKLRASDSYQDGSTHALRSGYH